MRRLPSLGSQCLGLALLLLVAGCGKKELYGGLTEKEANEFIVKLAERGVEAKKVKSGEEGKEKFAVMVQKDKLQLAFDVLNFYGLPREKGHGIGQVYPPGGLIPGQFEEKAKYLLALTGEIEMTLRSIDRVVDARVHVVIPEESVLKDEDEGTVRPTASVLLKSVLKDGKKPIEDVDVKQLVSKAIEGLSMDDVSVVQIPVVPPVAAAHGAGAVGDGKAPVAAEITREACLEKFKDDFADKAELTKLVGPIWVKKDSFKYLVIVLGALAGLTLVFFVLWLIAFLQASSLRKRLASATKAKVKKPSSTP